MIVRASWLTCTVVTSVLRPCLMMSVQGSTLMALAVNGDAMEASPARTCKKAHRYKNTYVAMTHVNIVRLARRKPMGVQGSPHARVRMLVLVGCGPAPRTGARVCACASHEVAAELRALWQLTLPSDPSTACMHVCWSLTWLQHRRVPCGC